MQRLVAASLCATVLGWSCFSERSGDLTEPVGGECTVAIDSPTIGSVGVILAIRDFQFQPAEIRIPAGTRVTWVNCETTVLDFHTTTSDTDVWGSPEMQQSDVFSRVFNQPGRFPYHCVPHPFMTGVIIVE
ncbi:MAG: plastocyanin/azurin family copper-binding protein [Gemmatimonadetes bacterium]|nr:plastocyanin/azurin family copper-binding protein [Gemmatimonadota bacterium]